MPQRARTTVVRVVVSLTLLLAQFTSLLPASAQGGPGVSISPASGPPPSASGSLSGGGWCPDGGVEVGGDAGGSASISRDGSLSGEFSVSGSAGQNVTVQVTAFCPDGNMSASATFTFDGGGSSGGGGGSSGPSPTRVPSGPPPRRLPTTGSLAILGCSPVPANIKLEFVPMRQVDLFGSTTLMVAGPTVAGKVRQGSAPGAYLFDLPKADPGKLFDVRTRISDLTCRTGTAEASDLWIVGDELVLKFPSPWTTELWASSRLTEPPKLDAEVKAGSWEMAVSTFGSLAGRMQVFKWETDLPGTTSGWLQASVLPFPSGAEGDVLAPAGLVSSWPVSCVNCVFSVDLSPLAPAAQTASVSDQPQGFIGSVQSLLESLFGGGGSGGGSGSAAGGVQVIDPSLAVQPPISVTLYVPPTGGFPFAVNGYYFRIIPQTGEAKSSEVSNTVLMNWQPKDSGQFAIDFACLVNPKKLGCPTPTPEPEKPYLLQIVSYKTFNPPDGGHEGCYLVTKQTAIWFMGQKITYKPGDKFCEPPPEPKGWLEKAWDFTTGALNWVSKAYADLKAEVVNLVAKFVPSSLCGKACLGTILDGALASMGIPPSIPNFDQLVNQGMDYLAEQAVQQIGFPPSVTGGLTGALLDEAKAKWEETVKAKFKEGMQAGLLAAQEALSKSVSYVPDGVPVKPDPDGEYQMPTMVIRILNNPKYAGPPGCAGNASVMAAGRIESSGASIELPSSTLEKKLVTNNDYQLFHSPQFIVPALAPGQVIEVPVAFKAYFDTYNYPFSEDTREAWAQLYNKSTATFIVAGSCGKQAGLKWDPKANYP